MSCLHGPHHGAQKSTSTGWRFDSSITSFMKRLGGGVLDQTVGGRRLPLPRRSAASSCVPRLAPGRPGCPAACSPIKWVIGATELQSGSGVRRAARKPARSAADGRSLRRNLTRSSRAIEVVMVLTSGWQLMTACSISAASSTTVTRPARVVDGAERRHRAGRRRPASPRISSAEPNEKRPVAPSRRCSDLQLDRGVLQRDHQEQRVLLVLEEQVLGVAAGNRAAQRLRSARP